MPEEKLTKEERLAKLKKIARETNTATKETVLTFGNSLKKAEFASFGHPEIDKFFGGGIQHGRFACIWGGPGSTKTTLALMLTAKAQKEGKIVLYVALEKLDPEKAKKIGVNVDELIVGQFPQAEQCLDAIIKLAEEKAVDVIIVDSIHSMSPKADQEDKNGKTKSIAEDTMMKLAQKLSKFFAQSTDPVERGNVAVLLIGQTRIGFAGIIAIQQLTGGNALHHACKAIVKVSRGQKANAPSKKVPTGKIKDNGKPEYEEIDLGFEVVLKSEKCQVTGMANEGSTLRLPFYYESCFEPPEEIKKELEEEEQLIKEQETSETKTEEKVQYVKEENTEVKKSRGRPKKG